MLLDEGAGGREAVAPCRPGERDRPCARSFAERDATMNPRCLSPDTAKGSLSLVPQLLRQQRLWEASVVTVKRLRQLGSGRAAGALRVQKICLKHLAYEVGVSVGDKLVADPVVAKRDIIAESELAAQHHPHHVRNPRFAQPGIRCTRAGHSNLKRRCGGNLTDEAAEGARQKTWRWLAMTKEVTMPGKDELGRVCTSDAGPIPEEDRIEERDDDD